MSRTKVLQPPNYDELLHWIAPESSDPKNEYHRIRRDLIRIAASRGCTVPEDLADEAIDRVARNVTRLSENYEGDPALYFHAVVRNVHREYVRRPQPLALTREPREFGTDDERAEGYSRCLDECLSHLEEPQRLLILDYYSRDRSDKIVRRRALAERLGIELNALRLRAHRIRERLYQCITQCLEAMAI